MKIFTSLINNRKKFIENYDENERMQAIVSAFIGIFIILFPVFIIMVQLFYCFIMRPYMLATISLFIAIILGYIYFVFKKHVLKNIKVIDGYRYNLSLLFSTLIATLIFIFIYLFACLYIIPKFVL